MSILSGAIGTMKKKGVAANPAIQGYQVDGTFNSKTYWVANNAQGQTNSVQLKTSNTTTSGTTSLTDGLANSNNMNNSTHPAAFFCRQLTMGGYSWFLPAKDELNHIYTNISASGKLLAPWGTHADKFSGTYYWSSSELSSQPGYVWVRNMRTGVETDSVKANNFPVRACRKG